MRRREIGKQAESYMMMRWSTRQTLQGVQQAKHQHTSVNTGVGVN